jgi:hypothetical protein
MPGKSAEGVDYGMVDATLLRQGLAEGYAEGFVRGFVKGFAKGKAVGEARVIATILTRLLVQRFGAIPGPVRQLIFSADAECIEAWVERGLDAPDLQSVFDSN